MPTYQYACTRCGHRLEAVQSFSDAPLTDCPECAGGLRKVFSAVGVVFKGSGFYRTDSRTSAGKATKERSPEKSEVASSGTKTSDSGTAGGTGGSGSSGGSTPVTTPAST